MSRAIVHFPLRNEIAASFFSKDVQTLQEARQLLSSLFNGPQPMIIAFHFIGAPNYAGPHKHMFVEFNGPSFTWNIFALKYSQRQPTNQ